MITYPFDLQKPWMILKVYEDKDVLVRGTSRVIQITDGESGGVSGTWRVSLYKLFTKADRAKLRLVRRKNDMDNRWKTYKEICGAAVAEHSNSLVD